jgi:hypothetical protein
MEKRLISITSPSDHQANWSRKNIDPIVCSFIAKGHWTDMKMKIYLEMLKGPKRENLSSSLLH